MRNVNRLLIIALLLSGLIASISYAYKLTGGKWATSSMPVAWKINSAGSADIGLGNSQTAVANAFNTWQATASYITFSYAGTTASTSWGAYDSTNLMVWFESNWYGNTGMSSSVIAVCRYWFFRGQMLDSDIAFNGQNYTWSASGQSGRMDAQNLATHEIGHFLGLADLYTASDTEKTMYGYASLGETKKRSLAGDDINGINALYPAGYPIKAFDPDGSYTWNNVSSGAAWTDIAVGDFDGDGNDETVVIRATRASWGDGGYPIIIIDPGGEMSWSDTSSGTPWSNIAAGDFDGDGNDEIVVTRATRATWGNGGYPIMVIDPGGEMNWDDTSSGSPWTDIAAGDFDGDGDDEIAVTRATRATWGQGGYPIMVFDPGGEMPSWSNTSSSSPWSRITAGDFDGDGDDEIAATRNTRATWGDGGYPIVVTDPGGEMNWSNTSSAYTWTDIAAGDFDGDGDEEIAAVRAARATWGYLGYPIMVTDPGGEVSWSDTSSGIAWNRIAAGDLDDDLDSDAEITVVSNSRANW